MGAPGGAVGHVSRFPSDSAALETVSKIVERNHPDIVEALPAPILAHLPSHYIAGLGVPILAGGLICSRADIRAALVSGATAVSTSTDPYGAQVNKMTQLSSMERSVALGQMAAQGVDVLVIGGGITGAGVALDAAARGYRVGLVEKGDFASGTSSKSTKLVHGGIRYLPQFDFELVHEALTERQLLLHNAPFLVKPLGFMLPYYAENKRPLGTPIVPPFGIGMTYLLQAGLTLYDLLAGGRGVRRHMHISKATALKVAPQLKMEGLKDAYIYYDGETDDTRLTETVLRTAARYGALITNYSEVIGFDEPNERIVAARVRDNLGGAELTINVGTVVNAGGFFAGRIEALAGGEPQIQIEPAKGVHLTVPRDRIKLGNTAVVLPETEDGRLLFIVPGHRASPSAQPTRTAATWTTRRPMKPISRICCAMSTATCTST